MRFAARCAIAMLVKGAMEEPHMSNPLILVPAAGLLALSACAYTAGSADSSGQTRDEVRGMAMLEGKTPGAPQQCVQTERLNGSFVPDEGTILYRVNSQLIYRTEVDPPCPFLDEDRAIITRTNVTQLCEGDQFEVVDPRYGTEYGRCSFGAFVPYSAARGD